MSSDKKRDVAKDLVDFLLNENKKPENTSVERTKKTEEVPTAFVKKEEVDISNKTKSLPDFIKPEGLVTTIHESGTVNKPLMASERGKAIYSEVSKLVGGAEAIRVAQARILELEKERDELRNQIDELLVTSESLQRQVGESKALVENLEKKQKLRIEVSEEEKIVMRERLHAREKELETLKKINEEIEQRFHNDLKKIRIREKEYENKNLILKAESAAVTKAKDEMILDLKRKIDQFQFEIDNYKTKFSATDSLMNEMREREVRAIKALRLALNILETDDFEETTQVGAKLKASGDNE